MEPEAWGPKDDINHFKTLLDLVGLNVTYKRRRIPCWVGDIEISASYRHLLTIISLFRYPIFAGSQDATGSKSVGWPVVFMFLSEWVQVHNKWLPQFVVVWSFLEESDLFWGSTRATRESQAEISLKIMDRPALEACSVPLSVWNEGSGMSLQTCGHF